MKKTPRRPQTKAIRPVASTELPAIKGGAGNSTQQNDVNPQ